MGYEIDSGKIRWAEQRVNELLCGEVNVARGIDLANQAAMVLKESADQMNNQPEADMVRAMAWVIEKTVDELRKRKYEFVCDRIELGTAIIKYREEEKHESA